MRGWRGVSLITSQGTLISDGNIWFTLSWRDSCIKSRNYPNQFKLLPSARPLPLHLFAYKTSTLGLRVQRLSCASPYICLPSATTNQHAEWRDERRERKEGPINEKEDGGAYGMVWYGMVQPLKKDQK